jgi:hypothetical protein
MPRAPSGTQRCSLVHNGADYRAMVRVWSTRPDAGQYAASVICQGPNNQINAGHLAAVGIQLSTTGTYDDGSFR